MGDSTRREPAVVHRRLLLVLVLLLATQLGMQCGPVRIVLLSPEVHVDEFSFELSFELIGEFEPGSLEVTINGESVLDRLSGGPVYVATIDPGAPLRDHNFLVVRARAASNGQSVAAMTATAIPPPTSVAQRSSGVVYGIPLISAAARRTRRRLTRRVSLL